MQIYGELLLGLGYVWTLLCAGAAFLGARFSRPNLVHGARYGLYAVAALLWALALLLSHAFLGHDFSNKYVTAYSDRGMATVYLLAAFWGGEKGALLFWALVLSSASAVAAHLNRNKEPRWSGLATGILTLCVAFFLILMVYDSNPFATFLTHGGPADGRGINPLLQNPAMTIHPPTLLAGYAIFSIPYAYGMATLILGRKDAEWIGVVRLWTVVSWLFLSAGLALGGLWAYEELGWGGYWMWDPVENAGLIPWFTSTAFLHSIMVEKRRGMLRRWNAVLVILTFLLTIFGTFLTRSQLISSVHAFADSTLSGYFLWLMAVITVASGALIMIRWRELGSEQRVESIWSREAFVILNNLVLVGCAAVVIWGTLFPKLSELESLRGAVNGLVSMFNATAGGALGELEPLTAAVDLGAPWFNRVLAPVGLVLVVLTCAGPVLAWRRSSLPSVRRGLLSPLLVAALPAAAAVWLVLGPIDTPGAGMGVSYVVLALLGSVFVLATAGGEHLRAAAKTQPGQAVGRLRRSLRVALRSHRRLGGHLVHLGALLCFLAFAGSAFRIELPERLVEPGDELAIGRYRLTFARLDERFEAEGRYAASAATFVVLDAGEQPSAALADAVQRALAAHGALPKTLEARPDEAALRVTLDAGRELLLAAGLVAELGHAFEHVAEEEAGRVRVYRYAREGVLGLIPRAFAREASEVRRRAAALTTLAPTVETAGESSVLRLRFGSAGAAGAYAEAESLARALPPLLNVYPGDAPGELKVVCEGAGRLLRPEVRLYEKHEAFTTEVALERHLREDLYLAMRPAAGRTRVNLMCVVFPLVSFLWLGSILMLLGASYALLPARWTRGRSTEHTAPCPPHPRDVSSAARAS